MIPWYHDDLVRVGSLEGHRHLEGGRRRGSGRQKLIILLTVQEAAVPSLFLPDTFRANSRDRLGMRGYSVVEAFLRIFTAQHK